jgi:phage-related holin
MIDDGTQSILLQSHVVGENEYIESSTPPSLSVALELLFAMNGITLALPATALLYIVNTRVELPLSLIPTYAAIAFLPFSLKPIYAYLSSFSGRRHTLLSSLLVASAISTAATALIPHRSITCCILLAFVRGITNAWPEFLLGLTLVDHAQAQQQQRQRTSYAEASALFQSQAATARNLGSLVAHALAFCIFLGRYYFFNQAVLVVLDDTTVTVLLVASGALNLVGAAVAWNSRVGMSQAILPDQATSYTSNRQIPRIPSYESCSETENVDCESLSVDVPVPVPADSAGGNVRLVILLQMTIILMLLRDPIADASSALSWDTFMAVCLVAFSVAGFGAFTSIKWGRSHQAGLFLILRHALPSASYLMDSYLYSLFASTPSFLQLLSLVDMVTTTLASWSYGRLFSRFSSGGDIKAVIAGTTLLASVVSLADIMFVNVVPHLDTWTTRVAVALTVRSLVTWTGEWNFLPDVVLATVSAVGDDSAQSSFPLALTARSNTLSTATDQHVGVRYGTLISCIDFGDQLGALMAGPLVMALGISRENDWVHLDVLIQISSLMSLLSIGLVGILP